MLLAKARNWIAVKICCWFSALNWYLINTFFFNRVTFLAAFLISTHYSMYKFLGIKKLFYFNLMVLSLCWLLRTAPLCSLYGKIMWQSCWILMWMLMWKSKEQPISCAVRGIQIEMTMTYGRCLILMNYVLYMFDRIYSLRTFITVSASYICFLCASIFIYED